MAYNINMALMCGTDIPIPECQLVVHQPTLKEIALIGDVDFFTGIQTICVSKNMITQGETLLTNTTNFQIFMTVMQEPQAADKRAAVEQVFTIIFPAYKISFTPRSLLFSSQENIITVDETNFDYLQKIFYQIFCMNNGPMETRNFNPSNAKAKEIADKLMRARQRVADQKGQSSGIFIQYISVLTVGLNSMSLQDCMNLTMYQLFDLIERYMLWINWDLDIRSRLAGGKPDSKPDNWMKDIHSNTK